jgi:hypothetical protein
MIYSNTIWPKTCRRESLDPQVIACRLSYRIYLHLDRISTENFLTLANHSFTHICGKHIFWMPPFLCTINQFRGCVEPSTIFKNRLGMNERSSYAENTGFLHRRCGIHVVLPSMDPTVGKKDSWTYSLTKHLEILNMSSIGTISTIGFECLVVGWD